MTDKSVEKVLESLKDAGGQAVEQIGELIQLGWPYFVRQQAIVGVTGILATITILAIAFVFMRVALASHKKDVEAKPQSMYPATGPTFVLTVVAILAGVVAAVLLLITFLDFLPRMLNPNYYAIQALLSMVRG